MAEYVTSIKTKQGNKRIDYNALANLPSLEANNITYDNSSTKLTATNTQAALDEMLVQMQNMSKDYVTNSDLSAKGYLTSVPSEYITETELANKNYLTSVPSEYVTETELINKKYLTSIPSEYVTETELNAKGYLTEHQDISNKANKATTLSGYGITDGTTKTEFNQLSQSVDNLKIDESDLTEMLEEVLVL